MNSRQVKWFGVGLAIIVSLYLVLLIPDSRPPAPPKENRAPFAWNRDEYWNQLENGFKTARSIGCDSLASTISERLRGLDSLCEPLKTGNLPPEDSLFDKIENEFFETTVLVAACPERIDDIISRFRGIRPSIKNQSRHWDINSETARNRIYRLLYGGRTAIEEIILQAPANSISETMRELDEPSAAPFADFHGVTIHSGDILVSRGGAPTSALIARGNDYPGNFSHIALVHVDETSRVVSIIESHIEKGVAVADIDTYLNDTKLRIMALRLRADLPALKIDPQLPHKAAAFALSRARKEHLPYDFAMDTDESSRLFCSEVASDAYARFGVDLWSGLSHISSPGARAWLADFGVRYFTTEEPSDLEYDPQVSVVAEWRDYETLMKDRLDNAVVDIMLEEADRGYDLDYDWYLLPVARIMKAYSVILNQFGGVGPVPEGMSATAALRNKWFSRKHQQVKDRLLILVSQFEEKQGYFPPYWAIIGLAREAFRSVNVD